MNPCEAAERERIFRRVLEEAHIGVAMLDELPADQPAGMSRDARYAYISARMHIYLRNILLADSLRAATQQAERAEAEGK